ncbi:hypothetical protein [Salirhabdus sp. Marseille-P4669]|uniref:hypothetical protein n=1 Tax=Salirhabdus sp. Marseille-P4669 TaxID=2042310 RepID=UPI000C7967A4|nr:hypothetical protein [Salirhabdus sp. Marseille-P4669]
MYRLISFVVIFTFVVVLLYFHNQNSHFTASNHVDHHNENIIEIPLTYKDVPFITGEVKQDFSGEWFLYIQPSHFTFAPNKVGLENVNYHEGHAHLYIDGVKINRIYDQYYNIGRLDEGHHEIKVTLNGNNHGVFVYNGEPISYTETIIVQ